MGRFTGVLGVILLAASAHAAPQICNLAFQVCPKTLEGTTINVPENVIWLEPKLPFCTEQVQVQTGGGTVPPSIVFIIDNSGSMNTTDPDESRFKVTKALLDSIYKVQPATKVGLSIFCRRLVFDHRDNPFFKTAFPGDTSQHDSYVPLTALNHRFPDGRSGLDSLKALLTADNGGALENATKRPATRKSPNSGWDGNKTDTREGTDITLGFEAAKLAMAADVGNAKDNQYFIFLSDGQPSTVDEIRTDLKWEWVKGIGVPTTFTVYFANSAPDSVAKMNTNIKANGYSTGNNKSTLWATDLPARDLLGLLSTSVLNPIFSNKPATPVNASLVSGTTTLVNSAKDAGNFIFPSRVPLAPNQTSVALTYNYTYTDSGKEKTHTATYNLNIRRVPAGVPPTGVTTICKDPGDIALFHAGQQIKVVTADHANLDVRLTLPNGEVCTDCKVQVQPSSVRSTDKEGVVVNPLGGLVYNGTFGRETSITPAVGDGKLQHLPTDSIVVIWVNPLNPLDFIRKSFPYSDVKTTLDVINHNVYSKTDISTPIGERKQWVLVGSPNVKITPEGKPDCCRLVSVLSKEDSVKYVGIKVTASRSFKVDIKVYSNLGQFVNKLTFSVSQSEFMNLNKEPVGDNRSLRILWDNRTEAGVFAGTGAYIFKTTVTLNKIPGIAEDQVERTEHRLVGVVRTEYPK